MLNPDQFRQQAMDIIQKSKGVIEGEDAKTVFRAANIRHWPLNEHPTQFRDGWTEDTGTVRPSETLHTSQNHLHSHTLRRYMAGDIPEFDPDYEDQEYLPEVMRTTRGTPWINEGHHRLVASRLNDYPYQEVYEGPLLKY